MAAGEQKQFAKLYSETINSLQNNIISELGDLSKKDLHPKPVTDDEKKEEQDAMDQLNIQIHKIFLKNVDGSYEESDQSELIEDGVKARLLRRAWANGLDVHPSNGLMSGWMKTLFFGDYRTFLVALERWSDEGAKKLIEKRETRMNLTAIFLVIDGARCLESSLEEFNELKTQNQKGHLDILKRLLRMGANLKAKDIAGYTPLHHCLTAYGNDITLEMANLLLEAGADPNLQNRFGCTPLPECIVTSKIEAIELLLKFGARTDIKSYGSKTTALVLAMNGSPRVREIFSKNGVRLAKKERKELKAEGVFKCGGGCGKTGSKRCTGCYLVHFCSDACLKSAWKTHKAQCHERRGQYRAVQLTADPMSTISFLTGEVFINEQTDKPSKKHFIVKVQGKNGQDLLIYNEERSMMGNLSREGNDLVYDLLCQVIKGKGVQGQKAFFYAIFKERSRNMITLEINPETMVPAETW